MTVLLDGNVLIAITITGHVHHEVAARWFADSQAGHATTPITQGTLIRTVIRLGATPQEYLAETARHRGGRLVTFDRRLAGLHPDVADVIPL